MKRTIPIIMLLLATVVLPALIGCGETAPTKEMHPVDSLNRRAYSYFYRNIDTASQIALTAYTKANRYKQGKAEATNNLGFCAFMQMDFDGAEQLYSQVSRMTCNELERLIADIGLMKVYQRTAKNKEYYDYRNSALRRMRRIREDRSVFVEKHEQERLNYAFSEFYIVSAIYSYYLQQRPEAIAALAEIDAEETLEQDTAQYLYYQYVKGSAGLCEYDSLPGLITCEFDNLFLCMQLSKKKGYTYFEANCLQGIAELLNEKKSAEVIYNLRGQALKLLQNRQLPDSVLPYDLAVRSLEMFRRYNDLYQIAGTYRTIGTWLNRHGRYAEALDTLTVALGYVNKHHELYYHCTDSADRLKPYRMQDTLFTELSWINSREIKTVPEWIARIREQLSVAYAGMGMKVESDYNRNIYLDILYNIRQDKELESRYQALERESAQLNLLIFIVISGIVLIAVLFWILNRYWRRRNQKNVDYLRRTLEICQKITASIPIRETDLTAIVDSILVSVSPDFEELFGATFLQIVLPDGEDKEADGNPPYSEEFPLAIPDKEEPVGTLRIYSPRKLTKDVKALINVIAPYIAWTLENGQALISLGDREKQLEKERYVYEQHVEENKRQNVVKKACLAIVTGIHPFIDRIMNETDKLQQERYAGRKEIKKDKYQYIGELIDKINEYNDILALWIKMKQGALSLNIENFALNDLLDVLAKGRRTFESKKQSFVIEPTGSIVKADKALTLFMINTLTENARKYTREGGHIRVYAEENEEYVEISVEDDGRGISPEDVSRIMNEKVYDSKLIGAEDKEDADLQHNKGFGFGLMNCKGIIEKYRKTNALFDVCLFSVESTPGKGSRFFFRLPKGIRKAFGFLLLLLAGLTSCAEYNSRPVQPEAQKQDTVTEDEAYDRLLDEASYYADRAYNCNVDGYYREATVYIDSAMQCLNEHYQQYAHKPGGLKLYGRDRPAELTWWKETFDSDYPVILDIRNEAAVAFLALRDWEAYNYNNEAYTALYKLVGEDTSLAEYCRQLQHSTNNKVVGIILCVLLLLVVLTGYYLLYIRRRFMNRRNLEQILDINRMVFDSSLVRAEDNDNCLQVPERIVDTCFDAIDELLIVDCAGIAVYDLDSRQLKLSCNPQTADIEEEWMELMKQCFEEQTYKSSKNNAWQCFPLLVDVGDTHRCVGVLAFIRQAGSEKESDILLSELIAHYIAIVIYNAVVKPAAKYQDIELAEDEMRRASFENSQLHVQNMVLDNCLSTIKHETIYYPNRIKQIIDRLNAEGVTKAAEQEDIKAVGELVSYYKDIYTILSSCASRQLEEVTFRRTTVGVRELTEHAGRYLKRQTRRLFFQLNLQTEDSDLCVTGDAVELKFLLENLIDNAVAYPEKGILRLSAQQEDAFVRFNFTDTRRQFTQEELNLLFYPHLSQLEVNDDGRMSGTEYLVCKQIIRDHDEFAGRRGCRINAEPCPSGGFTVYFTIPIK